MRVFESLLAGIGEGRWSELADLYAPDTVVEQPMMPPRRLRIQGRDEVRRHFEAAAGSGFTIHPTNVVIHQTSDPELLIAEFDYHLRYAGRTTTSANIQVMRIRDGLIVESRDYHDHLRFAALAGRAEPLADACQRELS
jgi:ketosteroid isomerase-like protein